MNDQTIRFRLGIFVLGTLILLAVLITLFGGAPTVLKAVDRYTIVFDNASGVGPGTPVRRSGVKIGEVENVELDNETGQVHVTLKVDSGVMIRKADQPTIIRGLLGSDSSVDFITRKPEPGRPLDVTPVAPGSTLRGISQPDTGDFLQQTAQLLQPTQETLAELRKTFSRFEKTASVLEDTLREYRELGKTARELPADLKKTSEQFRKLAQSVDEAMPAFRKLAQSTDAALPDVRKLVRSLDELTPQMRRTAEWVERVSGDWSRVGERVNLFLRDNETQLTETIRQLNTLVNEENRQRFARLLNNLETGTRQINSVLTDENVKRMNEIVANVERSSKQLDGLVQDSRLAMRRLGDSMTKADSVLTDMQKATEPLGRRSGGILKNLDEATDNLNLAVTEFRELMRYVVRGEGTIPKLLSDPALYNNMDQAICGINRLLPRLDRILRDVEIFADKIARHPESLGLGGVINPGTGLKEAPMGIPWRRQH